MFSARDKMPDQLLTWYKANARDLPWRLTREPYAIWISEMMLQQTQVATVLPRYTAWFSRFPNIQSIASSTLDSVLKAWEGLGYYRRARYIHDAAQHIITEHDGKFPESFEDILKLPGIGRSTAGAIASFCFDANSPVLDGNVKRVLKRWYGEPNANSKQLWQLAQQTIDASGHVATWNQAMMELGATICLAKKADCNSCPVSKYCASTFQLDVSDEKNKAALVHDVHWKVHLHTCPDKGIWLTKRSSSGIWAGLWSPPITELHEKPDKTPCYIHLLTHRRLHLYGCTQKTTPTGHGQWVSDISKLALPTGIHRLLAIHSLNQMRT